MRANEQFLPIELLRQILLHMYNDNDNQTLTVCRCVSMVWYMAGRSIRWRHIYLNRSKSDWRGFLKTLTALKDTSRDPTNLIQSISLYGGDIVLKDDDDYCQLVAEMAQWVLKMHNLRSISYRSFVYYAPAVDRHRHSQDLQLGQKLMSIIQSASICSALENLEIQCIRLFNEPYEEQNHVCVILRKVLTNIRRLKVNMLGCCYMMFEGLAEVCVKLEEIVINFERYDLNGCEPQYRRGTTCSKAHDMRKMTTAARQAIDQGYMPNITHFVICGEHGNMTGPPQHPERDIRFMCYYRIDVLKQLTTAFPTVENDSRKDTPAARHHKALDLDRHWLLYRDPDTGQDYDLSAGWDYAEERFGFFAFVHGTSWLLSTTNIHLPAQEAHRTTDLVWKKIPGFKVWAANFERMRRTYPIQTRLWYLQEQVNRRLLEVKEFEGMLIPPQYVRERLDNENALFAQLDEESQFMLRWAVF